MHSSIPGNPNYGLFFNQTNVRYEFRDGAAIPVFYVDANTGAGVFSSTVRSARIPAGNRRLQ